MAQHYRKTIGRVLQEFDTGFALNKDQSPQQKCNEYLTGKRPDMNRAQHELMGGYVDMMAFSLKKWDSIFGDGRGSLGDEYYKAMAFGGLFKTNTNTPTDSFKELIPNSGERTKIKNIIKNEQEGNENSKGDKCD